MGNEQDWSGKCSTMGNLISPATPDSSGSIPESVAGDDVEKCERHAKTRRNRKTRKTEPKIDSATVCNDSRVVTLMAPHVNIVTHCKNCKSHSRFSGVSAEVRPGFGRGPDHSRARGQSTQAGHSGRAKKLPSGKNRSTFRWWSFPIFSLLLTFAPRW